jgi:hypothetical protein
LEALYVILVIVFLIATPLVMWAAARAGKKLRERGNS